MPPSRPNLTASVAQLTVALHAYHAASFQMSQALGRLVRHNHSFCTDLREIVVRTAPNRSKAQHPG